MFSKTVFGVLASAFVLVGPVWGQSSLGITGATLDVGSAEDETGLWKGTPSASVDVRVTEFHGLQGDLSFSDTGGGTIGMLAGHLYMVPQPGQKYGLFVSLSDLDGRAMSWVSFGAEGMLSLGENTVLSGRLGLGQADVGSLDYIFGGVAVAHEVLPGLEFEAALDVADFDETGFRATSHEASLTARYSPNGAPWGVYASVTNSGLTGRDGQSARTRIGLGVTFTFGGSGGTDPHTRMFRSTDPVAPLIRRGLW